MIHVQICGRMSISGPEGVVGQHDMSGAIGRQILAYLAIANGPVGRYELIDLVWNGRPTKAVDSTVNATVSRLRSAISKVGGDSGSLVSEQGQLELSGRLATSDYNNAVRAVDRCVPLLTTGSFTDAWAHASTAYSVVTRRLLPGVENTWVDHRRDFMHHIACRSLAVVAMSAMGRGRAQDSIFAARELVRREPHSDRAVRLLVAALLTVGDRGASRAAVHEWASRLQAELGVLPDDRTLNSLDAAINRRSENITDITDLIPLAS